MEEIIDKELYEKAVLRGNLMFFHSNEALILIMRCENQNRKILGIDAFRITESTTQPVSEHSIEFSDTNVGNWKESIEFIEKRKTAGLLFEVVVD
jgi:hypothetical protein